MIIAVIDYEMGNLKSVSKGLEAVGGSVCVTRDPSVIRNASKIVLPGVGAFPECMKNLQKYGLVQCIKDFIQAGKWFLGICLGLQLLFEESEEFGGSKGLALIKGRVKKFKGGKNFKVPHMGWNQIQKNGDPVLMKGVMNGSYFYFVHSFYAAPHNATFIGTTTEYSSSFCSSLEKDNILACQFHPEKSQSLGLKVLKNFVELK